jgi:hypothetical protein
MIRTVIDMDEKITFFPSCLLSKWGFSDGDLLSDVMFDIRDVYPELTAALSDHDVLVACVQKWVIPEVAHYGITVEQIGTSHNPIRASRLGGLDATSCWYPALDDTPLDDAPPITVTVGEIVGLVTKMWSVS